MIILARAQAMHIYNVKWQETNTIRLTHTDKTFYVCQFGLKTWKVCTFEAVQGQQGPACTEELPYLRLSR